MFMLPNIQSTRVDRQTRAVERRTQKFYLLQFLILFQLIDANFFQLLFKVLSKRYVKKKMFF